MVTQACDPAGDAGRDGPFVQVDTLIEPDAGPKVDHGIGVARLNGLPEEDDGLFLPARPVEHVAQLELRHIAPTLGLPAQDRLRRCVVLGIVELQRPIKFRLTAARVPQDPP